MKRLGLRNMWLNFRTLGKSLIVFEEFIEYTPTYYKKLTKGVTM